MGDPRAVLEKYQDNLKGKATYCLHRKLSNQYDEKIMLYSFSHVRLSAEQDFGCNSTCEDDM
jgi:hypothetical protein